MIGLTRARLFELFSYDPDTGLLVRRVKRRGTAKAGDVAGCLDSLGYIQIRIDGPKYSAHRIAWFYVTGEWPTNQIDHIDGNPSNNRWNNLREATPSENCQNRRKARSNNLSCGLLGVSWHKQSGKWRAEITLDGKHRSLGLFQTAILAHHAYLAAKRELHTFSTI